MFLTSVLCRLKKKFCPHKLPKGNIWRGKYRLVRKVNGNDIANMIRHLQIEDRNMFYLRNPYLSAKEYQGVGRDFVKPQEKMLAKASAIREKQFLRYQDNFSIEKNFNLTLLKSNYWE